MEVKTGSVKTDSIQKDNIKTRARDLLSRMTLEEKIGQLSQAGSTMASALPGFEADIGSWVTEMMEGRLSKEEFERRLSMCREDLREEEIRSGRLGSFVNLYDDEKVAKVQKTAIQESRLHIPLLIGVDVIRGYRTIFPTPLAQSCSFDMDVVRTCAQTGKREAWVSGVNWVFGPMLDIARDARWGRIVESPGEDPYLAGQIAAAQVKTFQEPEEDGCRVAATAKHFVAYGAVSGGQDYNTVDLSKKILYDIYLPPFKKAVDAGVSAVMSAFHDLDGVPCTMSRELLTDILRGEMGFDGFVVSDAEAVKQCVVHGTARDEKEAAALCLLAGGDMDMSSLDYIQYLPQLVEEGRVKEEDIDRACLRVLEKKFEYGLFDNVWQYDEEKIRKTVLCDAHRKAAREAGKRCAVLLKNDGILPISREIKNILVLGALSEDKEALMGPWSFTGNKEYQVTITEGLRNYVPEGVSVTWVRGFDVSEDETDFEEALEAARQADFIVAVAGETAFMSGEASSRADLHLAGSQERFLKRLAGCGKPTAVVLINGRPLAIGPLKENPGIGAILEAWHLGTEAGNAIAEILLGLYNPSGRLSVTFANEGGQEPMYYNHPNTGKPGGSFKFTSKYQDVPIRPLYPFGYGLSYTTFDYRDLVVDTPVFSAEEELKVHVTVENTGDRFGEETVQLYVHDVTASLARPVKELKGFRKIGLRPGETSVVEFSVPAEELGFYDNQGRRRLEPGTFEVFAGRNSEDALMVSCEMRKPSENN